MAWEYPILNLPSQIAGSTFVTGNGYQSSGQYLFVKQNGTNDTHVPCSAVTDRPSGIAQNNPATGEALAVMALGVSKVIAGATLTAGDEIGPDAQGRAVPKAQTSTGANYGQYVGATVLEGAGVGELATVQLQSPYRIH